MKRIIISMFFLSGFLLLNAQDFEFATDPIFNKGDRVANIGLGIGGYGALSVSAEQCIYDGIIDKGSIGAGIYVAGGYYLRGGDARFLAGVRGTFHYPFIEKFDTYFGIGAGMRYFLDFNYRDYLRPDIDGFVGARYSYSDDLRFFLEVGSSLGYLTGGISLNF